MHLVLPQTAQNPGSHKPWIKLWLGGLLTYSVDNVTSEICIPPYRDVGGCARDTKSQSIRNPCWFALLRPAGGRVMNQRGDREEYSEESMYLNNEHNKTL